MIRRLYEDKEFSAWLGKNANETASAVTPWERNGHELSVILINCWSENLETQVAQLHRNHEVKKRAEIKE